jgi:hypothetical protein
MVPMRWGLVPGWWKKSRKDVPATFNARAETVAEKRIKGLCGAKPPQKPRWTNAVRWEAIER